MRFFITVFLAQAIFSLASRSVALWFILDTESNQPIPTIPQLRLHFSDHAWACSHILTNHATDEKALTEDLWIPIPWSLIFTTGFSVKSCTK